jgi:hypothetical protein
MLTFRPISYADADLRSFKYIGSATREGRFCRISAGSSSLNVVAATPWYGKASAVPTLQLNKTAGTVIPAVGEFFPIFIEDPDPESVACTINQNDYCIGMALKSGNEFEVHYSMTEKAFSTFPKFTKGGLVCIGSTGKLTAARGGYNDTSLVFGQCLGTFNGKYVRVRVL